MREHRPGEEKFETARRWQAARAVRRQIAGLTVLGLLVLALSLWRAGLRNVFTAGWWHW
jgi:hypothetical protein